MPHLRNVTLLTLAVVCFARLQGWHFSSAQTTRALPPQAPSSQQPVAAEKMLAPNSSQSPFSNTAAITINASGNAAPYPSNINVSGVSSLFTRMEVTLNGFAHTFPDEVDIILVGPQGQRAILMSDAGGSDDVTGLNLTFAQTATTPIPDATALTTGTFRPTNYQNGFNIFTDTFPAPGPGALTDAPADLFVFNGTDPNGIWNLYVVDDVSGDSGSIAGGWTLTFTVPQIFTVTKTDDTNDGSCNADCSLREALALAQNGDLINFSTLFNTPQTINLLTASLSITTSVTIAGPGANLLTVRRDFNAATNFRIFSIPSGATNGVAISGMTITGGQTTGQGGGIISLSDLALTNVHVTGNQAGNGGGVHLALANGVFTNCTFSNNTLTNINGTGGGIAYQGDAGRILRVVNSTISGNRSVNSGGGIFHLSASGDGRLEITNSTITNNTALDAGGVHTRTSNLGTTATTTLRNTIVTNNSPNNLATAAINGGGAATFQTLGFNLSNDFTGGGFTPIPGSDITSATPRLAPLALYGGQTPTHALLHASPAINAGDASNATIDQRGVARVFGASADIGAVEMRPLVVTSTANSGAGSLRNILGGGGNAPLADIQFDNGVFSASQTITLTGGQLGISFNANLIAPGADLLTFSGNNNSRVFQVSSGVTATLSGMTITQANATGSGGGIFNDGTLTVTHSTVSGNNVQFNGGGIHNGAGDRLTVSHSTISGNQAATGGGGIDNSGLATVSNTTISGNNVTSGSGGGIQSGNANGRLSVINSTVTNNNANLSNGVSGVVLFNGSTATIRNSIIAGNVNNTTRPDVGGTGFFTSDGFNLIGNRGTVTDFAKATDQSGDGAAPLNPRLNTLQNNGGTTDTHALFFFSPALDKGNSSGATSDQRGLTRPLDLAAITTTSDGADIGAFEAQTVPDGPPIVSAINAPNVTSAGGATYSFTVTYADDAAINVSTIGSDVRVTGPNAYDSGPAPHSLDNMTNGTPRTVTYTIMPPGNSWDSGDNGTYTIRMFANEVADTSGNFVAEGIIGSFTVETPNITAVAPPAGRTAGGQWVMLTGSFTNLQTVTIGGVNAPFTGNTTQITVTTPAHAVGAVDIVLTPTSGSPYTKTNAFAYLPTVFTDDTLVVGMTTAKAQHIIELRQAVDALRAVAGLVGMAPWTDATLSPTSTIIKAIHITELRSYLDNATALLGYGVGSYTDPVLDSSIVIKRVHIEELRQRIRAIAG